MKEIFLQKVLNSFSAWSAGSFSPRPMKCKKVSSAISSSFSHSATIFRVLASVYFR